MIRTRRRNKAFTLVEILIVVVILGILAAIVVPQFTNATQDAQAGNLQSQLKSLQNQIELYSARNNGTYPDFSSSANAWGVDLTSAATTMIGGGYIKSVPKNPAFTGTGTQDSVSIVTTAGVQGSATTAWVWNSANRTLYASNFNETTGKVSATSTD